MALFEHYVEYLTSPAVLLTLVVVVVPILLSITLDRLQSRSPETVPGCRRIGLLHGRSNLEKQFARAPETATAQVTALFTYPIKSCCGIELPASQVDASGLSFDRLFTFAQLVSRPAKKPSKVVAEPITEWDHQWHFITQREFPRLALIKTELWLPDLRGRKSVISADKSNESRENTTEGEAQPGTQSRTRGNTLISQLELGGLMGRISADPAEDVDWAAQGGCLIVRFPFEPDYNLLGLRTEYVTIKLPLVPTALRAQAKMYSQEQLSIWKDDTLAFNVTNEIDPKALAKLKYFLGVSNPLALFRVDEMHMRAVSRCLPPNRQNHEINIRFADSFPVNLLSLASICAIDDELPQDASAKGKLDARRFRANIYVSGVQAFEEYNWKRITLGRRLGRDHQGLFETDAEYHVACRTARCKLPNVDTDTGVRDEPYSALRRTRKVDNGAYPHLSLGMQMIPLFQRGMIKVGDEVEVLETGGNCYDNTFA